MGLLDFCNFEAGLSTSGPYLSISFNTGFGMGRQKRISKLEKKLRNKKDRVDKIENELNDLKSRENENKKRDEKVNIILPNSDDIDKIIRMKKENKKSLKSIISNIIHFSSQNELNGSVLEIPDVSEGGCKCKFNSCDKKPIAGEYCTEHFCNISSANEPRTINEYVKKSKVIYKPRLEILNISKNYHKNYDIEVSNLSYPPYGLSNSCNEKDCSSWCIGLYCKNHGITESSSLKVLNSYSGKFNLHG